MPAEKKSKKSGPARKKGQNVKVSGCEKGKPIWDKLEQGFSLNQSRRCIALAVTVNECRSEPATLSEDRKYLKEQIEIDNDQGDKKTHALKLWETGKAIEESKHKEKAATGDLLRLVLESVGGDLFVEPTPESNSGDVEVQGTLGDAA